MGVLLSTAQLWGRGEEEELQEKILSLVDIHRSMSHARVRHLPGASSRSQNMLHTHTHTQVLLASTLHTWSTLDRKYGLTPTMLFAWKAFLHHIFAILESQLPPIDTPGTVQAHNTV